jgi:hypothetical protein
MLDVVHERARALIATRRARRNRRVGIGVLAIVAFVAVAVARQDRDASVETVGPDGPATSTTLTRTALSGDEGWTPMAAAPIAARSAPIVAWTGEELLIWRGDGAGSDMCMSQVGGSMVCGEPSRNDGAAYNPQTNTWRTIPASPMPKAAESLPPDGGVWTGTELVVWDGHDTSGAAYNPQTNTWRSLPKAPLEAGIHGFSMTWTGREVVVIAARETADDSKTLIAAAAAYNPLTDTWRKLPPPAVARIDHAAVWTGSVVVVVGGTDATKSITAAEAYDPGANTWRTLGRAPLDDISSAEWTGTELIALGSQEGDGDTGRQPAAAAYDLVADTWQLLPVPPIAGIVAASTVWTGREVLVFGAPFVGMQADHPPASGYAYDPVRRAWRELPDNGLSPRSAQALVWTGDEAIAWGGASFTGFTSEPYADGARYGPGRGR